MPVASNAGPAGLSRSDVTRDVVAVDDGEGIPKGLLVVPVGFASHEALGPRRSWRHVHWSALLRCGEGSCNAGLPPFVPSLWAGFIT
eukprot:1435438-Heterocapsa_arctica.AAC.1